MGDYANATDARFGPYLQLGLWAAGDNGTIYHCTGSYGHETIDAGLERLWLKNLMQLNHRIRLRRFCVDQTRSALILC